MPRGPYISTEAFRRLGGIGGAVPVEVAGGAPRTLRRKVRVPIVWSATKIEMSVAIISGEGAQVHIFDRME